MKVVNHTKIHFCFEQYLVKSLCLHEPINKVIGWYEEFKVNMKNTNKDILYKNEIVKYLVHLWKK